jgi:hypothetical protein
MAIGKTTKVKGTQLKNSEKTVISYTVLRDMDGMFYPTPLSNFPTAAAYPVQGNPSTPAEFDEIPSNEGKLFFNPYEDATDDEESRCLVNPSIYPCELRYL